MCFEILYHILFSRFFFFFFAMVITNVFSDSISHLNMVVNLEKLQCVASSMKNKMITIVNWL